MKIWLFIVSVMVSANGLAAPQQTPAPDDSSAQRRALLEAVIPADWQRFRQREPVFDSELFWVEAGPRDAPTVLMVHGLGSDGLRSLLPSLQALVGRYRIIAPDLPGFGLSEQPRGHYSPTRYARLLHWLVKQRAGKAVVVVGHSMGGAVALRFAGSYPQQVERLVLVSSAGVLERSAFLRHAASLPVPLEGVPDVVNGVVDSMRQYGSALLDWTGLMPDPAALLQSSDVVWDALTRGQPNINAALCLVGEDYSAVIASLEVPVYLIWGTDDAITPPRTGRLLAGRLRRAQLTEIIGAGHMPMATHTELFNQLLLEALAARGTGQPYWRRPAPVQRPPDLLCRGKSGGVYQGYYARVELDHCDNATLMNVTASSLSIVDSTVDAYNLSVSAKEGAAIAVSDSDLTITNAELSGDVAVSATGSKLDLAGVSLRVRERAIVSAQESSLTISVSDLESPGFSGALHGAYRLADDSLDAQLR